MLRFFTILFLIFSFLNAEEVNVNSVDDILKYAPKNEKPAGKISNNKRVPVRLSTGELEKKTNLSLDDLSALAPSDESELKAGEKLYEETRVKQLTIKITNIPKTVYENELFKIDFKADIGQDIFAEPNLEIITNDKIKWINKEKINWIKGNGIFETPLYFEALQGADLENITMRLTRNGEVFAEANASIKLPAIKPLNAKDNFSNIVADSFELKSYKTSKFDDNTNLMTLNLSVKNANLGSFHIDNKSIIKQGVDSAHGDFTNQNGFYFAVIDNKVKSLNFSYFNLKTKKFENFVLNINVESEDLSTQTGLNPKESKFKVYKNIFIYALAAFLLVLFIASKNITPLIIAVIILISNFLLQKPYGNGTLSQNAVIRILPIGNSSVFYVSKGSENVEILNATDKYFKILLKNGRIGWVEKDKLKRD